MALCRVPSQVARWRWLVTGQVQGVGFRPFVYRTARTLPLTGFVRNDARGVLIECQGSPPALRQFESDLREHHPALAYIRQIAKESLAAVADEQEFVIADSSADRATGAAEVTVDTATCPACVNEILSPGQRRHNYGLTNCTDCGPRFSIIRRVPYDRCNTTMSHFEMCGKCHAEYSDPLDRRFHAQPIACADCGPRVWLVDSSGQAVAGDPIGQAREMLRAGKILSIKGLGGFHLAVRADDENAVLRLRRLKKRDHKPFALMVASLEVAKEIVELSQSAVAMMQSPACPIVLAKQGQGARIAAAVAPGQARLGVMLPYTPIHHLLFKGGSELPTLVMTSGNLSDEPLAIENHDALQRLGPMCDAVLWHDRPIERGVDDSVVIDVPGDAPIFLRRARGYVPAAIELPAAARTQTSGICLGGELKNTIAVVRNGSAILSHHLGDLTHPVAFTGFRKAVDDMRRLFGVEPQWIAHDLHPMYVSTTYARKLAAELRVAVIGVQHHHAHAASVMAEHGVSHRILAIVCDGTGYGTDGTIWGGELLAADLTNFERLARLRPLRLPGGDAAARDTARCAMALLHEALGERFAEHPAAHRLISDASRRGILVRMIHDGIACAQSSGAGRWFDGIAGLLGLCDHNHFEAQAAMATEAAAQRWEDAHHGLACQVGNAAEPLFEVNARGIREIDLGPLVRELINRREHGTSGEELAYLFHEQFAQAWASVAIQAAARTRIDTVGLSGGVFCNAWLTRRLGELLQAAGLTVLRHRITPPNDGGLSLGQAAIASARVAKGGMVETAQMRGCEKCGVTCA